jgi:membrane-associated phospholipid phosphatase
MKIIAQILSILFHPLLIPVYALLQMNLMPFFYPGAETLRHVLIFGSMFLLVVPPIIWYVILHKLKIVESWRAKTRKERIWPYLFTILSYLLVSIICYLLVVDYGFSQLWYGATVALIVVFLVNFFWKINAHATGMGSWTGMLIFLSIFNGFSLLSQIIVVLLSSGLIGWSRLKLDAHTPSQVFFGFLLGLICVGFLPFLIFL